MNQDTNDDRLFAPSEAIECGPWRVQLRGDEVAVIEHHGTPVLRAIRAVVRDHHWRTLTPAVTPVAHTGGTGWTRITLGVDFAGFGARYGGELVLNMNSRELSVTFDGVAPADFSSNRIGLVVLHRPDDAGRAVSISATDGTLSQRHFPVQISAHQPFMDIRGMDWDRDGTRYRLRFAGETFETEDQRNWTDASFKTYSTPLSQPFPVMVAAGDRVSQSIHLTAVPADAAVPAGSTGPAELRNAGPSTAPHAAPGEGLSIMVRNHSVGTVPGLGVLASASAVPLDSIPGLDSLMLELSMLELSTETGSDAEGRIGHAAGQAAALGVPLDVRLAVSDPSNISPLLDLLPLGDVIRLGVFHHASHVTVLPLWERLATEALGRGFTGTLVAGARSHFTELNRTAGTLPPGADAVVYSITPQMHAVEVPHVVESLQVQRQTALDALRLGSGRPLHIGPVTLKPRFNAVATAADVDAVTAEAMSTDPLQPESFTAAWLLGSLASLSVPGVDTISYFEASGPRGLRADDGHDTPAGQLLRQLAALRGAEILAVDGEIPGLALYPVRTGEGGVLCFAANLTAAAITAAVTLEGQGATTVDLGAWAYTVRPIG